MSKVTEIFGSMVFDDDTMEARLPKETYKALQRTIKIGKHLDLSLANIVANAYRKGRNALHSLVPTDDGNHG